MDFKENAGGADSSGKEAGVSRRTVVKGAAAVGLGVAAVVIVACKTNDNQVLQSSQSRQADEVAVDGTVSEAAATSACKIVPGDEVAQSLLAALSPDRLICRVADLSQYEAVETSHLRKLPVLKNFTCYSGGNSDFDRLRETKNEIFKDADLIVYANVMSLGVCQQAKETFYSETGIPYISLAAEVGKLADIVGAEVSETSLNCLRAIDAIHLQAAKIDSQLRFSVTVFSGKDGDKLCRNDVSLGAMRLAAGVKPSNLVINRNGLFNSTDADDVVVDNIEQDFDIDFILLTHQKAFSAYLGKTGIISRDYSMWRSTPVSATGDVLPALVSRRVWMESMSPFAQLSLGAAWLACYLYPDECECDIDELVTVFYRELFGISLRRAKHAADANRVLEERRGMSPGEIRSERKAYEEKMGKRFADWWQQVDEANTRPISSEEQAMIDKWVEEGLKQQKEEQRRNRKYLEMIKGEQ